MYICEQKQTYVLSLFPGCSPSAAWTAQSQSRARCPAGMARAPAQHVNLHLEPPSTWLHNLAADCKGPEPPFPTSTRDIQSTVNSVQPDFSGHISWTKTPELVQQSIRSRLRRTLGFCLSFQPSCLRLLLPFLPLHLVQAVTRFSHTHLPPLDRGTT